MGFFFIHSASGIQSKSLVKATVCREKQPLASRAQHSLCNAEQAQK